MSFPEKKTARLETSFPLALNDYPHQL